MYIGTSKTDEAIILLNELSNLNIDHKFLTYLYKSCAFLIIAQGDQEKYAVAQTFLEHAIKLEPSNKTISLYNALISYLQKDFEKYNQTVSNLDSENLLQMARDEGLLKTEAEETTEVEKTTYIAREDKELKPEVEEATEVEKDVISHELFDPVKIHLYFQRQKRQEILTAANAIVRTPKALTSWHIDPQTFKENTTGLINLNSGFSNNYYGVISPEILAQLDHKTQKQFQNALEKGICYRKTAQNGVKFINGGPIELKINGDVRLYATKIYTNEDSKKLIIFNNVGDHQSIRRMVGKMEVENIAVANRSDPHNISSSREESTSENKQQRLSFSERVEGRSHHNVLNIG